MTVQAIYSILKNTRFTLEREKFVQAEIYDTLAAHLSERDLRREYYLDSLNIIDFLLFDSIGIEVKLRANKRLIYKQCARYCEFEKINKLILVTNTMMGFPEQINAKDCYVLNLSKAWL